MPEVCRLFETWNIPVEVLEPLMNDWVVGANGSEVALEVANIHNIKSDDSSIRAYVNFGELLAKDIGSSILVDQCLELVKCREDCWHIVVVVLLGRCETGFVDATVEVSLHPDIDAVNGRSQVFRIEVNVSPGAVRVKDGIEGYWQP